MKFKVENCQTENCREYDCRVRFERSLGTEVLATTSLTCGKCTSETASLSWLLNATPSTRFMNHDTNDFIASRHKLKVPSGQHSNALRSRMFFPRRYLSSFTIIWFTFRSCYSRRAFSVSWWDERGRRCCFGPSWDFGRGMFGNSITGDRISINRRNLFQTLPGEPGLRQPFWPESTLSLLFDQRRSLSLFSVTIMLQAEVNLSPFTFGSWKTK